MAVSVGNIVAHLDLQDKMSRKLEAAKKKFRELGDSAQKNSKKVAAMGEKMTNVGNSARNAGVQLTAGLTLPIVALGTKALTAFASFEAGMNRVRAILGPNASQKDFKDLTATAEHLGRTTRFTAVEASEAMGFFALAGFKANEIMDAMPGTLDLAAAGQMDVATAADIAAKTLRGYGMAASEVTRVSDVMAKAFTSANTDLRQLGEAMKYAGPVAKSAGIEFEDLTAAMALMADAGFQGTMGGTAVRGAIVRLLAPTKKSADIMKRLGINVTDATGRIKPLDEIIRQLEPHADRTGDMMVLFGQRAGPALASLVGRGSEALVKLRQDLRDAAGTTQRIAQIQMEGLKGAFIELQSAAEGLWIAIGQSLAPTFESLLDDIKGVVNYITSNAVPAFANLGERTKKAAIGTAAGVAVLGPLSVIFGQMSLAAGGLFAGFALLGKQGLKLAGAWAGLKVAALALGKAVAVVGAAIVGWKIGSWIRDTLNLTPIIGRLTAKMMGLTDAQIDATDAGIAHAEALEGTISASEALSVQLKNLDKMNMEQLTSAFHNLARANMIGREEMELFLVKSLELQQGGEELSDEMVQLIADMEGFDEATFAAQQAEILLNQQLAESAERAAAVADAIHSIGFGEARDDLLRLQGIWAGLSKEEQGNLAVITDIGNQYEALAERLGNDVDPELRHVTNLMKGLTDQYSGAVQVFGKEIKVPPLESLPEHVQSAFQIGEEWYQAIDDGIQDAAGRFTGPFGVGGALVPPPAFPEHMYTTGKKIGANLKTGFSESLAKIPELMIDAFTGGGGLMGAMKGIGTMMGSQIGGDIMGALGSSMGKDAEGNAKGGLIGSIAGMMGPIGMAIGALAGPLIGGIVKLFKGQSTQERIQEAVTDTWGQAISDGLAESIAETADEIGSDWGGMMMHLADIFKDAGGVMAFGLKEAISKTRDLFSAVEMGTLTVEQASASFGTAFRAIADEVVASGQMANRQFLELLALQQQFGFDSVEVLDFIGEQSERVFGGLAEMMGPLQEETEALTARFTENAAAMEKAGDDAEALALLQDELNVILNDQQEAVEANSTELDAFATIAVGAFGTAIQAGLGFVEAARLSEPAISSINSAFVALGLTSDNVAFNHLARWNDLILQNETLVNAVDAFDEVLLGLSVTGGLTAESLAAMADLGVAQFDRLIAAGFTENEALLMMAPNIFALVDAYEAMGIPIDENTQELLDMAIANGQVNPSDQVSGWELVTGAIGEVVGKLQELIDAIRGVPDELEEIPSHIEIDVEMKQRWTGQDRPSEGGGDDEPGEGGRDLQHGGVGNFGAGTPAMLHGPEAVIPLQSGAVPVNLRGGDDSAEMLDELRALREELELLPVHLRDAIITSQ